MPTIMDEIIRGKPLKTDNPRQRQPDKWLVDSAPPPEQVLRSIKIDCSNVCDYMYLGSSQENWNFQYDFPNLAPPFQNFWIEWRAPNKSNSEGKLVDMPCAGWRIGVFIESRTVENAAVLMEKLNASAPFHEAVSDKRGRWVLLLTVLMAMPENDFILRVNHNVWFVVDEQGHYVNHGSIIPESLVNDEAVRTYCKEVEWFVRPGMLALSFMHCKNVTMETQRIDEALRKRMIKRHGVAPVIFKTLNIEPMKQLMRNKVGTCDPGDSRKPLHIMRGHFKDYREGAGLGRGHAHGMWFWATAVRGSKEVGIVNKEYKIVV